MAQSKSCALLCFEDSHSGAPRHPVLGSGSTCITGSSPAQQFEFFELPYFLCIKAWTGHSKWKIKQQILTVSEIEINGFFGTEPQHDKWFFSDILKQKHFFLTFSKVWLSPSPQFLFSNFQFKILIKNQCEWKVNCVNKNGQICLLVHPSHPTTPAGDKYRISDKAEYFLLLPKENISVFQIKLNPILNLMNTENTLSAFPPVHKQMFQTKVQESLYGSVVPALPDQTICFWAES